jgi:hypothetical protein
MGQESSTHSTYEMCLRNSGQEPWRDNWEEIIVDGSINLNASSERDVKMRAEPDQLHFSFQQGSDETSDYVQA